MHLIKCRPVSVKDIYAIYLWLFAYRSGLEIKKMEFGVTQFMLLYQRPYIFSLCGVKMYLVK
jgi:hypothetical protein